MIRFTPGKHSYVSIDPSKPMDWISVSGVVKYFKQPFDPISKSESSSKNPRSKWYGMDPKKIRQIWSSEKDRSLGGGNWYHSREEESILDNPTYDYEGKDLKVVKATYVGEEKYSSFQTLEDNHIYPEHMMYSYTDGICGQSDLVAVKDSKVHIKDHKTFKEMKTEGFTNWEGMTQRLKDPLSHMDDCNFVHAALQMSLYMYMILKHNPQFKDGDMTINHVLFELDHEDQYGYPVYKKDRKGNFLIKEIKPYKIPYLKSEVRTILEFLKENRELFK